MVFAIIGSFVLVNYSSASEYYLYPESDYSVTTQTNDLNWKFSNVGDFATSSAIVLTSAVDYCASSTILGDTGYRLPTVKEFIDKVNDDHTLFTRGKGFINFSFWVADTPIFPSAGANVVGTRGSFHETALADSLINAVDTATFPVVFCVKDNFVTTTLFSVSSTDFVLSTSLNDDNMFSSSTIIYWINSSTQLFLLFAGLFVFFSSIIIVLLIRKK